MFGNIRNSCEHCKMCVKQLSLITLSTFFIKMLEVLGDVETYKIK